jgi:FixJ family two-component response regulator
VENHRAEIMHRTRCKSLPELARLAMAADPGGA